jgi:hypothetical protein
MSRKFEDIISDLVTERTTQGDNIKLEVSVVNNRPKAVFFFSSYDPEKRDYPKTADLSSYFPDQPFWYEKDVKINEQTGEVKIISRTDDMRGFESWQEYLFNPGAFVDTARMIIQASGRNFYIGDTNV